MGRFEDLFDDEGERQADFRSDRKKRVGAYVLGRTLGEGSFAKVRLGIHLVSREKVAIKVVNKRAVIKREYARRNLHREAAMLQRLDHPNIIKLYEVMETENHYYLVTELADGYDFMGYISERYSLGEEEARRYMRQIVSAVDHMHHSGVIHRDLKIENLMFDKDMNVKIIDFGLGNSWDGHSLLTTQCGSPAYAAPEIFSKKPYGTAVDLWSVGVNLFAMLTGNLPFTADPPNNLTKLHAAILKGCNPPSNVSKECQDVLLGLMDTNENSRMTMAELKEHPWIKSDLAPLEAVRLKTRPVVSDLDEVVISHMVKQLGMNEAQVRDALLNNKVNAMTATYHLLCKRKMKGLEDLGPGMPREFLAQKWTTPNPIGEMGTLKQGELPKVSMESVHGRLAGAAGNVKHRQSNIDSSRMLQRQQMTPSQLAKSDSLSRIGSSGSKSNVSQSSSKAYIEQTNNRATPSSTMQNNISSRGPQMNSSNGQSEKIRLYKQSSVGKGTSTDSYKDCLSKLRSHRERPGRSILKTDAAKPSPIKPVTPMNAKTEVELAPTTMAVPLHNQDVLDKVVVQGSNTDMFQLSHQRGTSASTKSVRFNLEPDGIGDDTSTVVSFRSSGHPSQMERLVLRRLSADRIRRENILSMTKIHYNKDHWEINQDAIDTLRKRGSPDSGSLISSASSGGRMRAMRVLRRSEAQNPPPPPPNSALGRHRGVPVNNNNRNNRHSASAKASSASSSSSTTNSRGQHQTRLFQSSPGGSMYADPQANYPNGHLLPRSRQAELLDNHVDEFRQPNDNIRFHVQDEQGTRLLVWDMKVLESGKESSSSPEPQQRSGSVLADSPSQMRKLGTLRGQVAVKNKPNISEMVELKSTTGFYRLPDRPAVTLSRGVASANQSAASPKSFTAQPLKVKLRSPRGGGVFAMKDPYAVALKGSDSQGAK